MAAAANDWTIDIVSAPKLDKEFSAAIEAGDDAAILRRVGPRSTGSPRETNLLFWIAANRGLYAAATALLNAGAHVETTYLGMPVLGMLLGACNGSRSFVFDAPRLALCELLVQRGADVDAHGLCGRSALNNCAAFGYTESVRFLLKHGAKTHGFSRVLGDYNAPLVGAAGEARVEIVKMLLAAGADPNETGGRGCSVGYTPLHAVANEEASEDVAELLIAAGADRKRRWDASPSYGLKRGATPLQIAKKRRLRGLVAVIEKA